jgi:serine/threonine-protein kinase RsbW/sigma-B regulation protein RsbU (phosphoserine phosphatase)
VTAETVELRLANDLAALAELADRVERFGAEQRLSANVVNALNVVLDEAVSNAINHGYAAGARGEIAVRLRREPDGVTVEVVDDGRPFDPLQAPPPDLTLPLEQRPIGGLGVHLIRNLMDEVSYARIGGRNVLKMAKHLGSRYSRVEE